MNVYFGPHDFWYRFLAGLTVTPTNFLEDQSLWIFERTQRYQLQRLRELLEPKRISTPSAIVREAFAEYLNPDYIEASVRATAEALGVDPDACIARLPHRRATEPDRPDAVTDKQGRPQ